MYSLTKEVRFEASHCLTEYDGDCARLHGHSWRVRVTVEGARLQEDAKRGMLIDYADLGRAIRAVVDPMDHNHLNELLDFYPTSEMLAYYIFKRVGNELSNTGYTSCWVQRVEVQETDGNACTYEERRRGYEDIRAGAADHADGGGGRGEGKESC